MHAWESGSESDGAVVCMLALRPCFSFKIFLILGIVALLFLSNNYYLIMN